MTGDLNLWAFFAWPAKDDDTCSATAGTVIVVFPGCWLCLAAKS